MLFAMNMNLKDLLPEQTLMSVFQYGSQKNFNLDHIFWGTINSRTFIFGVHHSWDLSDGTKYM